MRDTLLPELQRFLRQLSAARLLRRPGQRGRGEDGHSQRRLARGGHTLGHHQQHGRGGSVRNQRDRSPQRRAKARSPRPRRRTAPTPSAGWTPARAPCSVSFSDPSGSYLPLDYDADPSTPSTPDMVNVVAGKTSTANAVCTAPPRFRARSRTRPGAVCRASRSPLARAAAPKVSSPRRPPRTAPGRSPAWTSASGASYSLSFSDPPGLLAARLRRRPVDAEHYRHGQGGRRRTATAMQCCATPARSAAS